MLTTREASKIVSVSQGAIRKYIVYGLGKEGKKEKLKAIKVMRGARPEYRIKLCDLDYFKNKYLTVKAIKVMRGARPEYRIKLCDLEDFKNKYLTVKDE